MHKNKIAICSKKKIGNVHNRNLDAKQFYGTIYSCFIQLKYFHNFIEL